MQVRIRPVKTHKEYRQVEEIQKEVWQFEDREVIPSNELITAQNSGGIVLGAWDPARRLVGFCFGIVGLWEGKPYHCSRMLAVLPRYQGQGIGYRLKLAQRSYVLGQGMDLISWTFDPLQSRNAYLNIVKLGVIIRRYAVNLYGMSSSPFNLGWETDRFYPEWWIRSDFVCKRLKGHGICVDLSSIMRINPMDKGVVGKDRARCVAVEIPSDIDELKARDPKLARRWRRAVREVFIYYFDRGYTVTGFLTKQSCNFYILEKGFQIE
jgi:predicted GNAT superfamily acetyltransferase